MAELARAHGTSLDAEGVEAVHARWADSSKRWFDRFLRGELDFAAQKRKRIGDVFPHIVDEADQDRVFEAYLQRYEAAWQPFPDVVPILTSLSSRFRLGVVTNGDADQQRSKLERTGLLQFMQAVVISTECGVAKPRSTDLRDGGGRIRRSPSTLRLRRRRSGA